MYVLMQNDYPVGIYDNKDDLFRDAKKIVDNLPYNSRGPMFYLWYEQYELNSYKQVGLRTYIQDRI